MTCHSPSFFPWISGPARLAAVLALAGAACGPATDLALERARRSDGGPAGAAGADLVSPAPGSVGVPRNLAALVLRLPAADAPMPASVRLRQQGGGVTPTGEVLPEACGPGATCVRVPITATLGAAASYDVEIDAAHAAVVGSFVTAEVADEAPPRITDLVVEPAGACVRLRFATDEPAETAVALRADGAMRTVAAGAGLQAFDLAFRMDGFAPNADVSLSVQAVDRAGNAASTPETPLHAPPALPPFAITEVLANPAGLEPTQEFVELRNLGLVPLSVAGLRLEDASGGDTLPDVEVPAGGWALVVPAGFDVQAAKDVAPRPGTVLLRVDARLGGDGLGNGGEPVRLRDRAGTEISAYGGWIDVSSSTWNGRSVHRLVDDACDHPSSWTRKPLVPTPGGPRPE